VLIGVLIALMAPVAVFKILRRPGQPVVQARVLVAVAAVLGMTAAALSLPATSHFEFVGHGRFAYPAASAAAVVWSLGLTEVWTKSFVRRSIAAVYALVVTAMLLAGVARFHATPQLDPGPGIPPAQATVISAGGSGQLDGVTITVDKIAFDYGAKATWVEVTATNSSSTTVDWPAVPLASDDGVACAVDYLRSTHMPGDIKAGQRVIGWLRLDLDPGRVHGSDGLLLRFNDVAVDDYRTMSDILVWVSSPARG